jgi:hypothetical protein
MSKQLNAGRRIFGCPSNNNNQRKIPTTVSSSHHGSGRSSVLPSARAVSFLRSSSEKTERRQIMTRMNDGLSGLHSSMTKSLRSSSRRSLSVSSSYPFHDGCEFHLTRKRRRRNARPLPCGGTRVGSTGTTEENGDSIMRDLLSDRISVVGGTWINAAKHHRIRLPPVLWIPSPCANHRPAIGQCPPQWNYFGHSSLLQPTMTRAFATTTGLSRSSSSLWRVRLLPAVNNHHPLITPPLAPPRPLAVRSSIRFVTTNNNKGGGETAESTKEGSSPTSPATAEEATTSREGNNEHADSDHPKSRNAVAAATAANLQGLVDSTVSSVRPIVGSAEATIKRAVQEWNTGDLLSVYGIVFLIIAIVSAPLMARYVCFV